MNHNRIVFLDYLRAVACLMVVAGHVYLVGGKDPNTVRVWVPTVTGYIFGPDPNAGNPVGNIMDDVTRLTGIGAGAFGVGIFFLVSGFVIMRALDREPVVNFVVRRIFRIYPTCLAVTSFLVAALIAYSGFKGVQPVLIPRDALWSGLVLYPYAHSLVVIPVLWTLEVEIAFYAVMALATAVAGRLGPIGILVTGASCLLSSALMVRAAPHVAWNSELTHASVLPIHITFLLVGSMIYRQWSAGWRPMSAAWIGASVALYIVAYRAFKIIGSGGGIGIDLVNAEASLGVFAVALWSGMRWRWIRPLRWIGDVSYPLYLIHIPFSWVVLAEMAGHGWGLQAAAATAITLSIMMAWVVHVAVEVPSQKIGALMANRITPRPKLTLSSEAPADV